MASTRPELLRVELTRPTGVELDDASGAVGEDAGLGDGDVPAAEHDQSGVADTTAAGEHPVTGDDAVVGQRRRPAERAARHVHGAVVKLHAADIDEGPDRKGDARGVERAGS